MQRTTVMRILALPLALAALFLAGRPLAAQHDHQSGSTQGAPSEAGQDAFAAIAEIVAILEADPRTDWSTVNIEALRQHLIDMNDVVLRATARETRVPGGLRLDVTGAGRTIAAIRRMIPSHAAVLDQMPQWSAAAERIPGGTRLTVLSTEPGDIYEVAHIRGLGFAGLLATGAHHQQHHLAIARGATPDEHQAH
jgi:hypothetical protein